MYGSVDVNYLAVLVAAIASMVLGWLWYGPLFGKAWMAMSGQKDMGKYKGGMGANYFIAYLGSAVTAYGMAYFLSATSATTLSGALMVAFWAWLGFVATVTLGSVLWERQSWSFWFLKNSYNLLSLLLIAWILFAWK
jgi:hypothetical protein